MISTKEEFLNELPIPDTDFVYRQVNLKHLDHLPNQKKQRFPKELHFTPDDDGLSVHWSEYATPEYIFKLIGISYQPEKEVYKDPRVYRLFKIPVGYIRSLTKPIVRHTPVFHGNPAPVGFPNNYAHASVIYPNDVEIRLKLSDYCQKNLDDAHCKIDFHLLDPIVGQLRERLNKTPYHNLPLEFEPDQIVSF